MSIIPIALVVAGLLGAIARPSDRRNAEPTSLPGTDTTPEILRRPLRSRF